MKTLASKEHRRFDNWRFIIGMVLIIVFGLLLDKGDFNERIIWTLVVFLLPLLSLAYRVRTEKRKLTIGEAIEDITIGIYQPEDERDVFIKMEAATAAFRAMFFISWLVFSYFFITTPGLGVFTEPAAWGSIVMIAVGHATFMLTLRKRGIPLSPDDPIAGKESSN